MGVASALQWWEDSQLRVLVLGSLVVQYILLIASIMRRKSVRFWWVRPVTWLAYLGGDAIAIYGLATLFNHYKKREGGHGYSTVEVLWAPVLLIHLGGQDGITAYNIEDNELWLRHILTAVSQITVAIYVFWKSWPRSDRRLLQAAILLFIPGILKCIEKPMALYSASINSLVSSEESVRRTTSKDGNIDLLDDFVIKAADCCAAEVWAKASDGDLHLEADKLFVDLASPSENRLKALECFSALDASMAYCVLRDGLSHTFDLIYTKQKMFGDPGLPSLFRQVKLLISTIRFKRFKQLFRIVVTEARSWLLFAAIPLFHHSHRKAYIDHDVKVTYALICGTAGMPFIVIGLVRGLGARARQLYEEDSQRKSTPSAMGERLPESKPKLVDAEQLDGMVFQYNLLGLFTRNQKYPNMMTIVGAIGCRNVLQQRWCMKSTPSSRMITALVLKYVRCGWKEGHMHDVPSYNKFNDNRGQFTLRGQRCYDKLGWTLQGAFDESVLLWHLATDFCYHYMGPSRHGSRCTKGHAYGYRCPIWCEASAHHDTAVLCTHMSNYMTYLLFVKPDMLMAGTRRDIFTRAYKGLERIMGKAKKPMLKERELVQRIVMKLDGRGTAGLENFGEALVHDAWDIAKMLMALSDEENMWKVIQGVWVEMLCFSAARCRGYLHAKAQGTGVEYLSYVWLLMYYMGMETLADRLQRVDHHDGGEPTRSDYCCGEHQAARRENITDIREDITIAG